MGVIETKTLKSGNSSALRLPKVLGFPPGTRVRIENNGKGLTIEAVEDVQKVREGLRKMFDEIDAIWAETGGSPPVPEVRDPDIFPDRPGLY